MRNPELTKRFKLGDTGRDTGTLPSLDEYGNVQPSPTYDYKNYRFTNEYIQTPAYNKVSGRYNINDPTNIGPRGYIDPRTGDPYPTCQPFAKHLAEAMRDELKCEKKTTQADIR